MEKIIAKHSYYLIPNYDLECGSIQLANELSVFNSRWFRRDPLGFIYNKDTQELRIPRGYSSTKLSKLLNRDIEIDENPNKAAKMKIKLRNKPRDGKQLEVLKFLCGLGQYKYTRKYSQLFCDLRTAVGKTYCCTAAAIYYEEKVIIFTPSQISKLNTHWKDEFMKHAEIDEDKILIIQGSKMCLKVIDGKYEDIDVFIVGRSTALSFAKKHGWDMFEKFIKKTQAGIKIIDEAHLDFETNLMIDCHSNVKRSIYLTSSAGRGDRYEDKIFKRVFKEVPIMGAELMKVEDNYIIILIFKFFHSATKEQRIACKTKEGLSPALYSNYLIDKGGARYEFFTALNKAIKTIYCKYRDDTGKLLILGSTKELLNTISRFLKKNYPEFTVGIYTSDIADKKVRVKELDKQIILATEKGLGTGADIPDLQVMINVIPYSNWVYADQLSGRLRKIGKDVFYIEIVNMDFPEAAAQYYNRDKFLAKKSKDNKLIIVEVKD